MAEAQAVVDATPVAAGASANTIAALSASAAALEARAPSAVAPIPTRLTLLERLNRAAVGVDDSEDLRLRKTLLMFASGLMNMAAILWLAIYWLMGLRLPTTIPLLYQALSALILVIYLKTQNFDFFRVAQLSLFLFAPFVIQWSIGSFVSSSGIVLLALLAPVGAMVVYGPRESMPWFAAYVILTALSGVFDYFLANGDMSGVPMRTIAVFFVLNFTILSSIVYLLLRYFVQQKDVFQSELSRQHALVRKEQQKSEQLLTTILPSHIAQRLKQDPATIADGFADVSVMFADIVNFTSLAEELTPKEVVSFLDGVFTRFDELAERHGVDKIKTIGDAYMVAGGLSGDGTHYVDAIVNMGLEMLDLMRNDELMKRYNVSIHVGVATGPVIAGVIGAKRFIYDLWGDTVNVASRITAEAPANHILVDKTTYRRLGARFTFGSAQELMFKGKGKMTVYELESRRSLS
ncbi:MAG: adenylate/guanylate cyclase domain-containing protein [Betaproteobacteria bacterium]